MSGANDVQGGGLFVCVTQPHPALRATLPIKKKGRDKKERAIIARSERDEAIQLVCRPMDWFACARNGRFKLRVASPRIDSRSMVIDYNYYTERPLSSDGKANSAVASRNI